MGGPRDDPAVGSEGDPEEHLVAQAIVWWEGCLEWLRTRLAQRDLEMEEQYRRTHHLNELEVRFEFTPGQWVVMK